MATNLIINGTFAAGNSAWTGTDLETYAPEGNYLDGGSTTNRVAEIDGSAGQTTVMSQSFAVPDPMVTTLTLDVALRNVDPATAGVDGFRIDITDAGGQVIATQTVLPQPGGWSQIALPVTFPAAGTYALTFTELGNDDSLGAVIDNVTLLTCFAGGTLIATPGGERAVERLRPGDLVLTEGGPAPLVWCGGARVSMAMMAANPRRRPIVIAAGVLGRGLPRRDLRVSRQHRIVLDHPGLAALGAPAAVMMPAAALCGLPGIGPVLPADSVTYHHLLLARHAVLLAEGAPAESLLLGPACAEGIDPRQAVQIRRALPGAMTPGGPASRPALPLLRGRAARDLAQALWARHGMLLAPRAMPAASRRIS